MIEETTNGPDTSPGNIACAFCGSTNTELFSLFGQSLISSQYYCHNCHTVFEAVRWVESESSQDEHLPEEGEE